MNHDRYRSTRGEIRSRTAIGRMGVSGSQSATEKITFVGQAKKRMVTNLLKVPVEGCALLLSVSGAFGGIANYGEPPFVPAPKEGIADRLSTSSRTFQPNACCENLVLEPAERGLPGAAFMFFSQGQPKCRVHSQVIGVIAILIACRNLIDPLAQQLEQRMIRMPARSWIINHRLHTGKDVEPLMDLSQEKKAGLAGDLCALKINPDGAVKFGPDGPSLFVTSRAH